MAFPNLPLGWVPEIHLLSCLRCVRLASNGLAPTDSLNTSTPGIPSARSSPATLSSQRCPVAAQRRPQPAHTHGIKRAHLTLAALRVLLCPSQFAAKQLNKLSTKCEKNEKLEKKKVKAVSGPTDHLTKCATDLYPQHMPWTSLGG